LLASGNLICNQFEELYPLAPGISSPYPEDLVSKEVGILKVNGAEPGFRLMK
jgi:hypothetical protein